MEVDLWPAMYCRAVRVEVTGRDEGFQTIEAHCCPVALFWRGATQLAALQFSDNLTGPEARARKIFRACGQPALDAEFPNSILQTPTQRKTDKEEKEAAKKKRRKLQKIETHAPSQSAGG